MDEEPREVDVARYLRFVIAFLLIMFSALGAYEYYYGAAARRAQELQQQANEESSLGVSMTVTTTEL